MEQLARIAPQSELDDSRLRTFVKHFEYKNKHLLLFAAHAAIPTVFTVDLLYKLRLNFAVNELGQKIEFPFCSVSDLVLSAICKKVAHQTYTLYPEIRKALIDYLRSHPEFGPVRVLKVYQYVLHYLKECPFEITQPYLREALIFDAQIELNPEKAAYQLAGHIIQALESQELRPDLDHKIEVAEHLMKQLEGTPVFQSSLKYAVALYKGTKLYEAGEITAALSYFEQIQDKLRKEQAQEKGLKIPIPQKVLEHLKITVLEPVEGIEQVQDITDVEFLEDPPIQLGSFPWNTDADSFQINLQDWDKLVVENEEIAEFLTIGREDHKFFIIGRKGMGTTLLLKTKSKKFRESPRGNGYFFIPQRRLCETMTKATANFSTEELNQYKNLDIWEDIWKLCLHLLIFQNIRSLSLPSSLQPLMGRATTLSNILQIILQNRSRLFDFLKLIPSQLGPQIQRLKQPLAIFIDNVDEAFDAHVGESYRVHRAEFQNRETLSPNVWVNAQLGLFQAIKDICLPNTHIKIYIALRSEVYLQNKISTEYQDRAYITKLSYTREHLEEIFKRNILSTSPGRLSNPGAKNLFERFIGIQYIPHGTVTYSSGEPVQEHIFSYLYRHTFGRPREIVGIGDTLRRLPPQARTPDRIRTCVNEESYRLLNQYKREQIPYFRSDVYKAFCRMVSSNVFTRREARRINRHIQAEFGFDNVTHYFYKMGLLGYAEGDRYGGGFRQKFLKPSQESSDVLHTQDADYYLVHPAMERDLKEARGTLTLNPYNIIGYDLPFQTGQDSSKKLHVHFGLSRLSRSMLLPILHEHTHLALIQCPDREAWGNITRHRKIKFIINQHESHELYVVHDGMSRNEVGNLIRDWKEGKRSLLLYTESTRIIRQVLAHVQSLSTSKGNGDIPNFMELLNDIPFDQEILVFPFEYTDREISDLERTFSQREINAKVVPIVADRFYYQKTIHEERGEIHIQCEPEGELYLQDIGEAVREVFPAHVVTRYTRDLNTLHFYRDRYRFLSDATFRLCKIWENYLGLGISRETFEQLIEVFCQMQSERLIAITPSQVLERAYPDATTGERVHILTRYGTKMLRRFDELPEAYRKVSRLQPYQRKTQKKESIPRVSEFDHYFFKSNEDYELIGKLRLLLGYPPNKNYYAVLIPRTLENHGFVTQVSEMLSAYGVDNLIIDFANGTPIESEFNAPYRILLIASEGFIRSQTFRPVLEQIRQQMIIDGEEVLIPIKIDSSLPESEESYIQISGGEEILSNPDLIREYYLSDWSPYLEGNNREGFQHEIKELITQSFRK